MSEIVNKLQQLKEDNYYPYHMPGHKRQMKDEVLSVAYEMDITEIDGFDNLHDAEGIILEGQERLAKLYDSEESHYLVNGSTVGILSAICGVTQKRDTILVARNCHKAVYNAIFLQELKVEYIYPERLVSWDIAGGIDPILLRSILKENREIKAVVITSPTYEGIASNIDVIAKIVHDYKIPLIVDEAHGAHFHFSPRYPKSAVTSGADIVVQSLHKTLPAFTQTAVLHMNGTLVDRYQVNRYLSIFQSSSPSYILMAGIERCVDIIEMKGTVLIKEFFEQMDLFLEQMSCLKNLQVLTEEMIKKESENYGINGKDLGKIVISVKNTEMTGQELYDILRLQYRLQMEMASSSYVLAIMTWLDTKEGFIRLSKALLEIDEQLAKQKEKNSILKEVKRPVKKLEIWQALQEKVDQVELSICEGKIAATYVNLYPPGIPLITPGEIISKEMIRQIEEYVELGLHVQGVENHCVGVVRVKNNTSVSLAENNGRVVSKS